jgi:hypothetical protein
MQVQVTKLIDGITLHKSLSSRSRGIRLYAHVNSASRAGVIHNVVFIRKGGMRRWLCDCEDFLFRAFTSRKHCRHIKKARALAVTI